MRNVLPLCLLLVLASNDVSARTASLGTAAGDASAPPAGSSYASPYLLDVYPTARAAYSLRRLSSTYTGPVLRVRRASNGAEQDIGFNGDLIDTAAILRFAGADTAFVITWYSQRAGAPHATAAPSGPFPTIAEGGQITTDTQGKVAIRFRGKGPYVPGSHLRIRGLPSYSSQDFTAFVVSDPLYTEQEYVGYVVVMRTPGEWGYSSSLFSVGRRGSATITAGDGSAATTYADIPLGSSRTTQVFHAHADTVELYRNHSLLRRSRHTRSSYGATGFTIGGESRDGRSGMSGFISEVVLYPTLGPARREAVYRNLNETWETGPTTWTENTLFPQDWPYQITLYQWLRTLRVSDVEVPPAPLVWDGSYPSAEALANLWLSLENMPVPELATRGQACWFVLNNGNGCGIEATGTVRLYNKGNDSNTGAYGNDPAFWYQLNVPLAGGRQGNAYYRNPAVARRALVLTAVEMMMWDASIETQQPVRRNDFFGKALSSWAYVYHHCKDVLDSETRRAFEAGFGRILDWTLRLGATDVNTNMDMFFVHGAAGVYASAADPLVKQKAVQAAKHVLFGFPDGALGTRHDVGAGTFFPAGYIGEADGPETTYNGHSLQQLVGALSWVHDEPEWAFLKEIVRRMTTFKLAQYFRDPPVRGQASAFYEGPSGYANRTGGSYVRDQGSDAYRDLTVAALVEEARPLVQSFKYARPLLRSVPQMTIDLTERVKRINDRLLTLADASIPPAFAPNSSWPADRAYLPPPGWYTSLSTLLERRDPSTVVPFDRAGATFSQAFGGAPTGDEFWAYKGTDGSRSFGFFVEADAQQGTYAGWYGGKLEAFWTEHTGILVLNRHDKTGCDTGQSENSTCWNQIDTWAANHVWGLDDQGKGFSTLQIRGKNVNRISRFSLSGATPSVEVVNRFNDASTTANGEETGARLAGAIEVVNRFEALPNGIRVRHTLTSDQSDRVTALWGTIPINLRYNTPEEGGQAALADATIEFWDGGAWRPLTTQPVGTSKLRIGRDYLDGRGPRYGYVGFYAADGVSPEPRRVKLSSQVWQQSYQGYFRIRNVHVDLHGSPGTPISMPALASVTYTIQTTEPAAAPVPSQRQVIALKQGWNLVARQVAPADSSIAALLAAIQANVRLVKNGRGQVYNPAYGIDEIGTWSRDEAYEVLVDAATTLTLEGPPLPPTSMAISLERGWNLVPYLLPTSVPVSSAFASIASSLLLAETRDGKRYDPARGIDEIGSLVPGEGYKVYVRRDATLTYPSQLP